MKTYTDTQRVDYVLALMERGVASIPTFSRHIGINDPIDRVMIDAAMRHEEIEKERIRNEKHQELLRRKREIECEIQDWEAAP